ncbi:hypothetical protein T552_00346 [Pneumocystis carinii B80]|uniref:non-specific serine/threonine protein kinase n=1 Tax=Pneumocystis carinii (strain B80) TaxID=1408658 RepID=A0A0W4ZQI1_PNEC8|nr:hypothetical protein T552_00346 [Pneumocystis carinii B80]KTW30630.1 hypothetical protein T552_00346 [Pneumocystis carinii B80]
MDIIYEDFYNKFFNSIEWPFKSHSISKDLNDLSFTDLALLVTTDGDLYGINRDDGEINWIIKGLNSIMKSERNLAEKDNLSEDYIQRISNNVDFFWFLEPSGDGSIYVFDFRIGIHKFPFNIKQLIKLSPYSFPGDDKVYIGRKETSLFVVNLNTGKIYRSFGSGHENNDAFRCFSNEVFGKGYDKDCDFSDLNDKNILKIGRIDYILNVYSGNRLLWNVSYSEWVPSFINVNFENKYFSMFDGKYILSTHNGAVFQRIVKGTTSSIIWYKKLDSPVTKVFDILSFTPISIYRQSELDNRHTFVMVEQPTDFIFKMLNKTYNRYVFINTTQIGNWYALSEERFPLIKEASFSQWHNATMNFGRLGILPLHKDLIGLHKISYDIVQILTIDSSLEPLKIDYFLDKSYNFKYRYIFYIFFAIGILIYFSWRKRREFYQFIFWLKLKFFSWIIYIKKRNIQQFLVNILTIFGRKKNEEHENVFGNFNEIVLNDDNVLFSKDESMKMLHLKKRKKIVRKTKKYKKGIENMSYVDTAEEMSENEYLKNQIEYRNNDLEKSSLDLFEFKAYDSIEKIEFPLVINSLEITNKILGYGSHGTIVYEGSFEGRKVAVKRMLLDFYEVAFREITLLQESDGHPNVIRYYCKQKSDKFLYIALELCSASLYDIIERSHEFSWLLMSMNVSDILYQIASGIQYLHSLKIIHRDIKPQNILVAPLYANSDNNKDGEQVNRVRIMISDFGLCKKLEFDQNSFKVTTSQLSGTIGWRAPELFYEKMNVDKFQDISDLEINSLNSFQNHKVGRAIDIFSMGCVFYYVLTNGMHPFGEYYLREGNIVKGTANYSHLDFLGNESFLAKDLISKMLNLDPKERPDAEFIVKHPYFWSPEKKLSFLIDASDRFETEKHQSSSELLQFLEKDVLKIIGRNWLKKINKHILENSGRFRKYDGTKLLDLLRILRNKKNHYQNLPLHVQEILGPPPDLYLSYFMTRFPYLLLHCYYIVKRFLDKENMHQLASYF